MSLTTLFIIACLAAIALAVWSALDRNKVQSELRDTRDKLTEVRKMALEHESTLGRYRRLRPDEDARLERETIRQLLVLDDHMQRVLDTMSTADLDTLRSGLELIGRDLDATWDKLGVVRIRPQPGDVFDASRHEAVDARGEGAVVHVDVVTQDGFSMEGELLRPARVVVQRVPKEESRETAAPAEEETDAEEEAETQS